MSPPLISHPRSSTSTPTRPYSTAKDHFSPGTSKPNSGMSSRSLDFEAIIDEWMDGLTSPLSTPSERISILNDIEKTLVKITSTSGTPSLLALEDSASFWALQATAGYSLAEVLLAYVCRLHLELQRENELYQASSQQLESVWFARSSSAFDSPASSPVQRSFGDKGLSDVQRQRVHSTVSEICIAITILQGLTLCSKASKRITQRKSSLELLLQIALADYCTQLLPPILVPSLTALTPTSPDFPTPTDAPLSLPSGFALDLLMCILVDSPLAQEKFADMGGIHQIVQLSHKCADTVTTPASTPTSAASPSMAEVAARSSHIIALKQTDLLCLEFRYFWSQVLQSEGARRPSLDNVAEETGAVSRSTTFYSVAEQTDSRVEPTTPKASLRERTSRTQLATTEQQGQAVETPKATRRRVTAPTSTRATSEEAPLRPRRDVEAVSASSSPRRLRHSTSVAELRTRLSLSRSSDMPPPPPLPVSVPAVDSPVSFKEYAQQDSVSRRSRASTSERTRRSTVSDIGTDPATSDAVGRFVPNRPGMSSRDRPRIPSPLKPRTAAQQAADVRAQTDSTNHHQHAIPYRRLRASTTSTPFSPVLRRRSEVDLVAEDGENQNPFASAAGKTAVGKMSSSISTVFTASESSRSSLGSSGGGGGARGIPPSPAVRRAMARARSLSPTKLSLPTAGAAVREATEGS